MNTVKNKSAGVLRPVHSPCPSFYICLSFVCVRHVFALPYLFSCFLVYLRPSPEASFHLSDLHVWPFACHQTLDSCSLLIKFLFLCCCLTLTFADSPSCELLSDRSVWLNYWPASRSGSVACILVPSFYRNPNVTLILIEWILCIF